MRCQICRLNYSLIIRNHTFRTQQRHTGKWRVGVHRNTKGILIKNWKNSNMVCGGKLNLLFDISVGFFHSVLKTLVCMLKTGTHTRGTWWQPAFKELTYRPNRSTLNLHNSADLNKWCECSWRNWELRKAQFAFMFPLQTLIDILKSIFKNTHTYTCVVFIAWTQI